MGCLCLSIYIYRKGIDDEATHTPSYSVWFPSVSTCLTLYELQALDPGMTFDFVRLSAPSPRPFHPYINTSFYSHTRHGTRWYVPISHTVDLYADRLVLIARTGNLTGVATAGGAYISSPVLGLVGSMPSHTAVVYVPEARLPVASPCIRARVASMSWCACVFLYISTYRCVGCCSCDG